MIFMVLDRETLTFSEIAVMFLILGVLAFLLCIFGMLLFALPAALLLRSRVPTKWIGPMATLGGGAIGALFVAAIIGLLEIDRLPIAYISGLGGIYGAATGIAWWLLKRRQREPEGR